MNLEQKIIYLEEQFGFNDQLVRELNFALNGLYQEQVKLNQKITDLTYQIQKMQSYLSDLELPIQNQIPPHY